jgi:hypothetical protein
MQAYGALAMAETATRLQLLQFFGPNYINVTARTIAELHVFTERGPHAVLAELTGWRRLGSF